MFSNGGFNYTPNGGAAGTDAFTYAASDGVLQSSPATVTITLTSQPPSDTVTIETATYTLKSKTLLVQVTSSAAPTAKLTLEGSGAMTYSSKTKFYTYQAKVTTAPTSVTVRSDHGGTATKAVTMKSRAPAAGYRSILGLEAGVGVRLRSSGREEDGGNSRQRCRRRSCGELFITRRLQPIEWSLSVIDLLAQAIGLAAESDWHP